MNVNENNPELIRVQNNIANLEKRVEKSPTLLFVHSEIKKIGKEIGGLNRPDRAAANDRLKILSTLIDKNANTVTGKVARAVSALFRTITLQGFFESAHTQIKREIDKIEKILPPENTQKTTPQKPATFQSIAGKLFSILGSNPPIEESALSDITTSLKKSSASFTETEAKQLKDFCDYIAIKDPNISEQTNQLKEAINEKIPTSTKNPVVQVSSKPVPQKKEVTFDRIKTSINNIPENLSPTFSIKKITKAIHDSSVSFTWEEAQELNTICEKINDKIKVHNPVIYLVIDLLKEEIKLKTVGTISGESSKARPQSNTVTGATGPQASKVTGAGSFTQIAAPIRPQEEETPFRKYQKAIRDSGMDKVLQRAIFREMTENPKFNPSESEKVMEEIFSAALFKLYNKALKEALNVKDLNSVNVNGDPVKWAITRAILPVQDKIEIYKTVLTEIKKTAALPKNSRTSYWKDSIQIVIDVLNKAHTENPSRLQQIQYGFKLGECFAALKGLKKDLTEPPKAFTAIFTNPQISLQEKDNIILASQGIQTTCQDFGDFKKQAILLAMNGSCSNFLQSKQKNSSLQLTTEIFKDVLTGWVKYANKVIGS